MNYKKKVKSLICTINSFISNLNRTPETDEEIAELITDMNSPETKEEIQHGFFKRGSTIRHCIANVILGSL